MRKYNKRLTATKRAYLAGLRKGKAIARRKKSFSRFKSRGYGWRR